MTIYAYLRVSTDKQDLENQRHAVLEYANKKNMSGLVFVEDEISSKKKLKERKIGSLIMEQAEKGDTVLATEVSRLGRNTLEVLILLKAGIDRGVELHIAKQNLIFDDQIQSKIYATVLGLAAEIERDFIQQRTKTALEAKKAEIKKKGYFISKSGEKRLALGNPKGSKYKLGLEEKADEITRLVQLGVSKAAICKVVGTSAPTLARYLKRNPVDAQVGIDMLTDAQRDVVDGNA